MTTRLYSTQNDGCGAQTRARFQARAIHMDTLTECVASKASSDLTALHIGALIRKTEETPAVEVQS